MIQTNAKLKYTAQGLIALLVWATNLTISKNLMGKLGQYSAPGTALLVGGIAATIVALFSAKSDERSGLSLKHTILCGVPFIAYMLSINISIGMATTKAQFMEITLINYLWPTLTLLISIFMLKNRARWYWLIPGVILAFSGLLLGNIVQSDLELSISGIVNNFGNNIVAYSLAFIAAFSWAFYSNSARYYAPLAGKFSIAIFIFVSGACLLLYGKLVVGEVSVWKWNVVPELALQSLLSMSLAYIFWAKAMRYGNMLFLVAFSYLLPMISTVFSSFYLNIEIKRAFYLACVMVIAGAVISKLSFYSEK